MAQKMQNGGTASRAICALAIILAALAGWYATWHHYRYGLPTPACTPGNMHLSIDTNSGGGTAGTDYEHAVITNQGNAACRLGGYPAVFLLSPGGAVLGLGAATNNLYVPTTFTLASGASAHAVLGFPDANNFPTPGACAGPSASLRLYLPGAVSPIAATLAEYNCPGFSVTALQPSS